MEELKITIPEGQEIDWQESAKQKQIVFKQKAFKPKSWAEYCRYTKYEGYFITSNSDINYDIITNTILNEIINKNLLPTKEYAKAFLAFMKLISLRQAWVGDWKPNWIMNNAKYCVLFAKDKLMICDTIYSSSPLSFPTYEMAEEFFKCFKDLIKEARTLL